MYLKVVLKEVGDVGSNVEGVFDLNKVRNLSFMWEFFNFRNLPCPSGRVWRKLWTWSGEQQLASPAKKRIWTKKTKREGQSFFFGAALESKY